MNLEDRNIKGRQILIKLIQSGKTTDVTANGLSMFPFLLPSDIIRVKPISPKSLKRGQIIVYELNHKIISHRYIKTVDRMILCKGDGLIHYDSLVLPENLLGIVIARTRNNKTKLLTSTRIRITGYLLSFITRITGTGFYYSSLIWYKWFYTP